MLLTENKKSGLKMGRDLPSGNRRYYCCEKCKKKRASKNAMENCY